MKANTGGLTFLHRRTSSQQKAEANEHPKQSKREGLQNIFNKGSLPPVKLVHIEKGARPNLLKHLAIYQQSHNRQPSLLKKDISAIPEEVTMLSDPKSKPKHEKDHAASREGAELRKKLLLKYHTRTKSEASNIEALKSFVNEIVSKKEASRLVSPRTQETFLKIIQKTDRDFKPSKAESFNSQRNSKNVSSVFIKKNATQSHGISQEPQVGHQGNPKIRRSISHTLLTATKPAYQQHNYEVAQPRGSHLDVNVSADESSDKTSVPKSKPPEKIPQKKKKVRVPGYLVLDGMNELYLFEKYPMIQFDSSLLKSISTLTRL